MVYRLSNKYAKKLCKRTFRVQLIVEDVHGYMFFGTDSMIILIKRSCVRECTFVCIYYVPMGKIHQ